MVAAVILVGLLRRWASYLMIDVRLLRLKILDEIYGGFSIRRHSVLIVTHGDVKVLLLLNQLL